MAHEVSDLPPSNELPQKATRAAKFHRPESSEPVSETVENVITRRQALFRPPEEIAVRHDLLEAFRAASLKDSQHVLDRVPLVRDALFSAALSDEALRRFESALESIAQVKDLDLSDSLERTVERRLLRSTDNAELVLESLEGHLDYSQGGADEYRTLLALERADVAWQQDMAARQTLRWVESAMDAGIGLSRLPVFTVLWATQLQLDALLETGRFDEALEWLENASQHSELDEATRTYLRAERAVWLNACGRPEEALNIYNELAHEGPLPGDLEEGLLALLYERGRRDDAFGILRRSE